MVQTHVQLNPQIPMDTPKGSGRAIFLIDYSPDDDLYWLVAIDATGELWMFANKYVRATKNITLDRRVEKPVNPD
jgi:hypothetical protein